MSTENPAVPPPAPAATSSVPAPAPVTSPTPAAAAPVKPTLLQQIKAYKATAGEQAKTIARAEKAEALLKARDGELAALRKENADLKSTITQLETDRAEAEETMAALMDEAAHVDKAASTRAAAIAGNQGIPEASLPAFISEATAGDKGGRKKELLAEYLALNAKDPSKGAAFYAKHEKEMLD